MEMNSKKIKYSIIVVIVLLMLMIFPFSFVREAIEYSSGGDVKYEMTTPMSTEKLITQTFIAQHGYLDVFSIAFAINDDTPKLGTILFRLTDESEKLIKEGVIDLAEVEDCIYYDINISKYLKKGAVYYVTLQLQECEQNFPAIYYTVQESQHTQGNALLLDGEQLMNGQAVTRFKYEKRIELDNVLCLWLFLITMGMMVYECLERSDNA